MVLSVRYGRSVSADVRRECLEVLHRRLFAHLTALRYGAHYAELTARAVARSADADQLRVERAMTNRHTNIALWIGVVCAVLSATLTFLSNRAEESAPRSVVIVLLLFYGILQFAVV